MASHLQGGYNGTSTENGAHAPAVGKVLQVFDADGNVIRKGDMVVVVACPNTEVEWASSIVRRCTGFDDNGNILLDWEGGLQPWPAKYCRKAER